MTEQIHNQKNEIYCPNCQAKLENENINSETSLAKCHVCHILIKINELIDNSNYYKSTPPTESKIKLTQKFDGTTLITFPKGKNNAFSISILAFAAIWLSIISVITFSGGQTHILVYIFLTPFWLIGIGLIFLGTSQLFSSQNITFNRQEFTLSKKKIFGTDITNIKIRDISSISLKYKKKEAHPSNNISHSLSDFNTPQITHSTKTTPFFNAANLEEKKWLVAYLNKEINIQKR